MAKEQPSGESLARAAQAYIDIHSRDKFSLDEISGALYVNGSYLMRAFKRYLHMTPLTYHHMVRCGKAKELLAHTDRSISEVGETVGFVSSSHFSHVFRKTEGCTPSEYRILHQHDDREDTKQ